MTRWPPFGAVEAVAAFPESDIKIVGFDATDDAQKAVKDVAATVAQKPDKMGDSHRDSCQNHGRGDSGEIHTCGSGS